MSGRKKNRKHRNGQPSPELLDELNSLRDLLGSDLEADIPLLDKVAEHGADQNDSRQESQVNRTGTPTPARPPIAPPRPLQESDLPILFSPVDEEPAEEYTPVLSDADRELLRPLQNLPREQQAPEPQQNVAEKERQQEQAPLPEEFQPGLFDAPKKTVQEPAQPASVEPAKVKAPEQPEKQPSVPAASAHKPLPTALTENPFLPPHIRARLTGGKVPRTQEQEHAKEPEQKIPQANQPTPDQVPTPAEPSVDGETADLKGAVREETSAVQEPSARDRLIEQLVAEQLPELERQLRANIIALVDEIYPESD
ncbi:hypothetical protein [uncultured Microbulbifer sp.]|uniref:hypothetical protein n=1 Tax=uncultured Microbulbifer sp. TaxID=348147 RepID=UPI002624AD8D|nr:hypothetical protein [uncultured Microbulbifer sp.]